MRAVRRLLWRAALFLWIKPRELKRSRIGWATLKAFSAPAASFSPRALSTFFTAVRSIERWLALRALRTTVCLARFLADLMFATANSWKLVRERWDCGKSDRKVWWIQWVASTVGSSRESGWGQTGAADRNVAFDRRIQRDDLAVARGRLPAGLAAGQPVRRWASGQRVRRGVPHPKLSASDLR